MTHVNYYRPPSGDPVPSIKTLLPGVINPHNLSPAELVAHGIAACSIVPPAVEWWQQLGSRAVDAELWPHLITWSVDDRPLADVQAEAWERVKAERAARRAAGVEHTFPDGSTGHIQIRDDDISNLLSIHAAATTALMTGAVDLIPFTDRENVTRWLTPADALAVAMVAFTHGAAVHVTSQARRGAIAAADTVAGVVAAAAWPEA